MTPYRDHHRVILGQDMKTVRVDARGLRLPHLLRQAEDRIVLLEVRGEERFALVPVDGLDRMADA